MGISTSKLSESTLLVNKSSSEGPNKRYTLYNKFGITQYIEKWFITNNIIYASKHSIVYHCRKKTPQNNCCQKIKFKYVVKVAPLSQNEIDCLKSLDHPNLVKAVEIYQTPYGMLLFFTYYP